MTSPYRILSAASFAVRLIANGNDVVTNIRTLAMPLAAHGQTVCVGRHICYTALQFINRTMYMSLTHNLVPLNKGIKQGLAT
jgi:hypothetical protein